MQSVGHISCRLLARNPNDMRIILAYKSIKIGVEITASFDCIS